MMNISTSLSTALSQSIVEHMNKDHKQALADYVRAYSEYQTFDDVEMVAIHTRHIDLEIVTGEGKVAVAIPLPESANDVSNARQALVILAHESRRTLAKRAQAKQEAEVSSSALEQDNNG
ncbi:hypothetical protein C4K68_23370 [Pokkaliibacter plantistimulans]|uniref:DUF2470 domain-containing protein n=1 Tax=Proteobacteria bacterium 228 TaxID=2083153 RepID=A0A2S5KJC6_9PROT|nr:DUF2470 domain-containing protein [Pokkaliibacter plantistimulans]PPC74924.1 hypothetical protein C4K68_23370 [Pokkaliibacter plantistimulans]